MRLAATVRKQGPVRDGGSVCKSDTPPASGYASSGGPESGMSQP